MEKQNSNGGPCGNRTPRTSAELFTPRIVEYIWLVMSADYTIKPVICLAYLDKSGIFILVKTKWLRQVTHKNIGYLSLLSAKIP